MLLVLGWGSTHARVFSFDDMTVEHWVCSRQLLHTHTLSSGDGTHGGGGRLLQVHRRLVATPTLTEVLQPAQSRPASPKHTHIHEGRGGGRARNSYNTVVVRGRSLLSLRQKAPFRGITSASHSWLAGFSSERRQDMGNAWGVVVGPARRGLFPGRHGGKSGDGIIGMVRRRRPFVLRSDHGGTDAAATCAATTGPPTEAATHVIHGMGGAVPGRTRWMGVPLPIRLFQFLNQIR